MIELKQHHIFDILRVILLPLLAAALILCFTTCVRNLSGGKTQEDKQRLEDTLRRSAVACYAAEGIYPPDIAYLEEHYGVQIDRRRFVVSYSAFADNLMPDITVLEK